jgi:hypothetical protein
VRSAYPEFRRRLRESRNTLWDLAAEVLDRPARDPSERILLQMISDELYSAVARIEWVKKLDAHYIGPTPRDVNQASPRD